MKQLILSTTIALLITVVTAWDEDPRCLRRRALFDPNEPDPSLLEDEAWLNSNGTVTHDDSIEFPIKNLRGSDFEFNRSLGGIDSFQLKMEWKQGYCWQEEWRERRWCLECEGSSCNKNDYLWVEKCSSTSRQKFMYREAPGSGGGRISPVTDKDLCWERTRVNAFQLRPCSSSSKQIILGFKDGAPFELHPYGQSDKCLNQHHHPKPKEIVRAEVCWQARSHKTSKWVTYYEGSGGPITSGSSGGGSSGGSGSKKIKYRGREYCDEHTCGECEGDCDHDHHCEGKLRCYQRDAGESVPGCSGGSKDKSESDYCYDPGGPGSSPSPNPSPTPHSKPSGSKPSKPSGSKPYRKDKGSNYCRSSKQCGLCEGDCDSDSDCKGSLVCHQRSSGEEIPGCSGTTSSDSDFCGYPH